MGSSMQIFFKNIGGSSKLKKKYKNLSRHIGRNRFMPTFGQRGGGSVGFSKNP